MIRLRVAWLLAAGSTALMVAEAAPRYATLPAPPAPLADYRSEKPGATHPAGETTGRATWLFSPDGKHLCVAIGSRSNADDPDANPKEKANITGCADSPHHCNSAAVLATRPGSSLPSTGATSSLSRHGSWNRPVRTGYDVIRVPLHQSGRALANIKTL